MATTIETLQVQIIGDDRRLRATLDNAKAAVERSRLEMNASKGSSSSETSGGGGSKLMMAATVAFGAAVVESLHRLQKGLTILPTALEPLRAEGAMARELMAEIGNVIVRMLEQTHERASIVAKNAKRSLDEYYATRADLDARASKKSMGKSLAKVAAKEPDKPRELPPEPPTIDLTPVMGLIESTSKNASTITDSTREMIEASTDTIKRLGSETVSSLRESTTRLSSLMQAKLAVDIEGTKRKVGMEKHKNSVKLPDDVPQDLLDKFEIKNSGQFQKASVVAAIVEEMEARQQAAALAVEAAQTVVEAQESVTESVEQTTLALQSQAEEPEEKQQEVKDVKESKFGGPAKRVAAIGAAAVGSQAAYQAFMAAIGNPGALIALATSATSASTALGAGGVGLTTALTSVGSAALPVAPALLGLGTAVASLSRGDDPMIAVRKGLMATPNAVKGTINAVQFVTAKVAAIPIKFEKSVEAAKYFGEAGAKFVTIPFRALGWVVGKAIGQTKRFKVESDKSRTSVDQISNAVSRLGYLAAKPIKLAVRIPGSITRTFTSTLGEIGGVGKLGGFIGAVGAVKSIVSGLAVASDMAKDLWKSGDAMGETFRSAEGVMRSFIETTAATTGASKKTLTDTATQFGLIFQAAGLTSAQMAYYSQMLTNAALDASSFYNIPVEVAMEKMRAGLVGSSEPLRSLGIQLSEAKVATEAYRLGLAPLGGALSETAKTMARTSLIMKGLSTASGHLRRNLDSNANATRRVKGEIANLQMDIGAKFQNVHAEILATGIAAIDAFKKMFTGGSGMVGELADSFAVGLRVVRVHLENLGMVGEYVQLRIQTSFANMVKTFHYYRDVVMAVARTVAANFPEVIGEGINNVLIVVQNVMHNISALFTSGWENIVAQIKLIFNQLITYLDSKTGGLVTTVLGEGSVMSQREIDAAQAQLSEKIGYKGTFEGVDTTQLDKVARAVADVPKPIYDELPARAIEIAAELEQKVKEAAPAKSGDARGVPVLGAPPPDDPDADGGSEGAKAGDLVGIEQYGQQLLSSMMEDPAQNERKKQSEYQKRMQEYQAEMVQLMRRQERRPNPATVS